LGVGALVGAWGFSLIATGSASLPLQSWVVLVACALLLLLLWSSMQWLGQVLELTGFKPTSYTVKKTTEDFVLLSEGDWPSGAKSKETNVLIRHRDGSRLRWTKQTIRYTKDGSYPKGTVALPSKAIDDLHLDFDNVLEKCDLEIAPTQRFFVEELWNNSEPSIRISTQTTFGVTLFTTAFSTVAGILTTWWFK
jgi:hypothetical protein